MAGEGLETEDAAAPIKVEIPVPGTTTLDLDPRFAWQLRLESDHIWAAPIVVDAGQPEATLTVRPTGSVNVQVAVAEGEAPPAALNAHFQSAADLAAAAEADDDEFSGELPCRLSEETWTCRVPVGRLDLRIRAEGFISHFFWDLSVDLDDAKDLGLLRLERGSSVMGWITTEDGEPLGEGCRVEILPQVARQPSLRVEKRVKQHALDKRVGEKGFFHLDGIAPGSHVVRVSQEGYSTAEMSPVVVAKDSETELTDEIVLRRPLDVEIHVTPPLDLSEKTWKLSLMDDRTMRTIRAGAADREGRWKIKALEARRYRLFVANSLAMRFAYEILDVHAGQEVYPVEMEVVWVDGELRYGDEPIAGTVSFGGVSGTVSIPMDADGEGRFSGWLPSAGPWRIDVTAEDPKVFRRLRNFPVEVDDATGVAHVEIELPKTLLEGEVVNPLGLPAPGARILVLPVSGTEPPSHVEASERGTFELYGYDLGTYCLEARAYDSGGELASGVVEVVLEENAPSTFARLTLRRMTRAHGRVVATDGTPVANAGIRFELPAASMAGLISPQTQTDLEGAFSIELPPRAEQAVVIVMAPGFTLSQSVRPIDSETEMTFLLDRQGGTLSLEDLEGAMREPFELSVYVHREDGTELILPTLSSWARMNGVVNDGSRLVVPLMPPGAYTACWIQKSEEDSETRKRCSSGFLSPMSQLTLVPGEPTSKRTDFDASNSSSSLDHDDGVGYSRPKRPGGYPAGPRTQNR